MQTRHELNIMIIWVEGAIHIPPNVSSRNTLDDYAARYLSSMINTLAQDPRVNTVELITRLLIEDSERKSKETHTENLADGAYITRIPGVESQISDKRSNLWKYLDVFSDQLVQHIRQLGYAPDVIHGHGSDGGYVGLQVARLIGVPFFFSNHNLARMEKNRCLKINGKKTVKSERQHIDARIEAEEEALSTAERILAISHHEKEIFYRSYENNPGDRIAVLPVGVEELLAESATPRQQKPTAPAFLSRYLENPEKPLLIVQDYWTDIQMLQDMLRFFKENQALNEAANLCFYDRQPRNWEYFSKKRRRAFAELLLAIDEYDLHGHIIYPPRTDTWSEDRLLRWASHTNGLVFRWSEDYFWDFGLLKAAAMGIPMLSMRQEGVMAELIRQYGNGFIFEPEEFKKALKTAVSVLTETGQKEAVAETGDTSALNANNWNTFRNDYVNLVQAIQTSSDYRAETLRPERNRLVTLERMIIVDIDNTLIGDNEGVQKLMQLLKEAGDRVGFAVATGRRLMSAVDILNQWQVQLPDVFITSVGSEIYYGLGLVRDRSWKHHLDYAWDPLRIREVMQVLPGLKLQPEIDQREFKISYDLDPEHAPDYKSIVKHLRQHKIKAKVIYSHGTLLDILPVRASKGLAIRFLALKLGLQPEDILVAGDSGNDEEMLRGNMLGVVVGNYSNELEHLHSKPRIYFAGNFYANGIIEGINHYKFLEFET